MSDTVKLIIEISKETYQDVVKNGFIYDEDNEDISHAIKNGTPLDDVKAEIKRLKHQYTDVSGYRWWNNAIDNCLNIIRDECEG